MFSHSRRCRSRQPSSSPAFTPGSASRCCAATSCLPILRSRRCRRSAQPSRWSPGTRCRAPPAMPTRCCLPPVGAFLLTASRGFARSVRQEAFIGVLYVVATAATVLVVDRSPQGAEHVKKMLVGGILSVSADELREVRRALRRDRRLSLAHSTTVAGRGGQRRWRGHWTRSAVWDLVFYLSFGVVVTSSVASPASCWCSVFSSFRRWSAPCSRRTSGWRW